MSQWLLKLHTYGLLRKSFRPNAGIRAIRTCWRERAEYVEQAGICIQRMQKALTEMNVQLATVLSDLSGVIGMKILRAIAGGERDGRKLAEFRDPNVKASRETIAGSLEGTWLPEQLAILRRQLADWDHARQQYRRLRGRLGAPKAITATAAKPARLVYRMMEYGEEYVNKGAAQCQEKYQQQKMKLLARQAAKQGFALVPLVQ